MSKIKSAPEKKRLSYERDHYNRGGENNKTWRKKKPARKAAARRVFRRGLNHLVRQLPVCEVGAEPAPKKKQYLRQKKVLDWGSIHLREFAATRRRSRDRADGVGTDQAMLR